MNQLLELYPVAFIISPISTLWVADRGNYLAMEFTLEGKWFRNILTHKDGVRQPWSVVYNQEHPQYIWLSNQVS